MVNCSVQKSKRPGSEELEIVTSSRSSCMPSPKRFRVEEDAAALSVCGMTEIASLEEVEHLAVNQHISVTVKVVSIEAVERQIPIPCHSRKHQEVIHVPERRPALTPGRHLMNGQPSMRHL